MATPMDGKGIVETCRAAHNPWPLTGKPYACVTCIDAALAERATESRREYEAWQSIRAMRDERHTLRERVKTLEAMLTRYRAHADNDDVLTGVDEDADDYFTALLAPPPGAETTEKGS